MLQQQRSRYTALFRQQRTRYTRIEERKRTCLWKIFIIYCITTNPVPGSVVNEKNFLVVTTPQVCKRSNAGFTRRPIGFCICAPKDDCSCTLDTRVWTFFPDILLHHCSADVFFLLFHQSLCSHEEGAMKFGSWPCAWDPRFLLPFLWAPYIIFQGYIRLPNYPIWQFCTAGGNEMYRDRIVLAIYCDWWATIDTA